MATFLCQLRGGGGISRGVWVNGRHGGTKGHIEGCDRGQNHAASATGQWPQLSASDIRAFERGLAALPYEVLIVVSGTRAWRTHRVLVTLH